MRYRDLLDGIDVLAQVIHVLRRRNAVADHAKAFGSLLFCEIAFFQFGETQQHVTEGTLMTSRNDLDRGSHDANRESAAAKNIVGEIDRDRFPLAGHFGHSELQPAQFTRPQLTDINDGATAEDEPISSHD